VPDDIKGQFDLRVKYDTKPFESKIVNSKLTLK